METNPLQPGAQLAADDQGLRPIEWSVLRARLTAAFELREAMTNRRSVSRGNSARRPAGRSQARRMARARRLRDQTKGKMVLLERIELSTSSLPMTRSTTELQQRTNQGAPYCRSAP